MLWLYDKRGIILTYFDTDITLYPCHSFIGKESKNLILSYERQNLIQEQHSQLKYIMTKTII